MEKTKEIDAPTGNWTQEGKPLLEVNVSVDISVEDWFICEMVTSYSRTFQETLNPGNINYKLRANAKFNLWSAWEVGHY